MRPRGVSKGALHPEAQILAVGQDFRKVSAQRGENPKIQRLHPPSLILGMPNPAWPIATFFEIRFKIKWLEKECIFKVLIKIKYISIKTLDRNQVHFKPVNQKLSKAVPPQVPPRTWQGTQGGLRRAWLRRTRDEGGTTNAASESSAGEVVAPA